LLDAIAVAYRHLVVHCDLKYANLLVTDGGLVQVHDFGIAKLLTGSR
jgi:serine/threonine-protein kinase